MTVRVNKSAFNIREKLSELERPIGVKGNELMRAETLQDARDFISAGRKNLMINGDMRIAQRSTSSSTIIGNNYRTLDRWRIQFAGYTTVVGSTSQSSESPPGFSNSLRVNVTTAETLASSDLASIRQRVEAQDCQQFAYGTSQAKTLTLSFWIRSSVTGTYTIGLYQTDDARHVTLPYTVDNADTWEHKVITIPPDTTGVIDNDNGTGLEISWNLSAGSTYKGTDHIGWGAFANARWANGQTADIAGTLSNLYLAGVQLEVGKNATEFEHRSYGEELALCQRYYKKISASSTHNYARLLPLGQMGNSTTLRVVVPLNPTMRALPSFNQSGTFATQPSVGTPSLALETDASQGGQSVTLADGNRSGTGGESIAVYANNDSSAYVEFSAEL